MYCYRIFIVIISFLMISCAYKPSAKKFQAMRAEEIYKSAYTNYQKKSYTKAAIEFLELDKLFPYSKLAARGRIYAAYCQYKNASYHDAIRNIKFFIANYPTHPYLLYAYYLLGMASYELIASSENCPSSAEDAREAFRNIVKRSPTSPYAKNVTRRIALLEHIIANSEMNIGRFYQTKNNYIAALPRFLTISISYYNTELLPEALFRIIECLSALGLNSDAMIFFTKYEHDFRGTVWCNRAKALLLNYAPNKKKPIITRLKSPHPRKK